MKLRYLAALHSDSAHAQYAIQWRLELIGSQFPELRLRKPVRSETVSENRKSSEGEPVRSNDRGAGQRLPHSTDGCIHQLKRLKHVDVPVKEQADLGRTPAGDGTNPHQSGHGINRIFNRLGDGYLHLLDRHYTVVNADHHTRKICLREDRDWNLLRRINTRKRKHNQEKEDWTAIANEPKLLIGLRALGGRGQEAFRHFASPPAWSASSAGLPTFTFVPSSKPYDPVVMTNSEPLSPFVT